MASVIEKSVTQNADDDICVVESIKTQTFSGSPESSDSGCCDVERGCQGRGLRPRRNISEAFTFEHCLLLEIFLLHCGFVFLSEKNV